MSLKNVQKEVDTWAQQYKIPYWKPLEIMARLTEETGELAREVNHLYGAKSKKPDEGTRSMGGEIADIIFTLCCLANSQNIDLDEAFKSVMDKCYGRDQYRFEKK